MSKAPPFADLLAIQLQARARVRWQDFNDIHTVLLCAVSHAYVLLCAASGRPLDAALPVVEFAAQDSIDTAERLTDADLSAAVQCALGVLAGIHSQLCEQESRFSEYVEASNALLSLKADEPGAVGKARFLAVHHRIQQAVRRENRGRIKVRRAIKRDKGRH